MDRFSVRNELQEFSQNQRCERTTRARLFKVFADKHILSYTINVVEYDIVEDVLSYFGQTYTYDTSSFDHTKNCVQLQKYIVEECKWYQVYDFLEYYIKKEKKKNRKSIIKEFNDILEDEKTGYHIISDIVTPITNSLEIKEIEDSISKSPKNVTASIKKAITLYSERLNPDYNNAIKEIITAVEALCVTIVNGEQNTLGKAVEHLSNHGIILNENLKEAIQKLYKYTCSDDGTRHGGTDYVEQNAEDARFMIVTCSAIINYLLVKWEKSKELGSNE